MITEQKVYDHYMKLADAIGSVRVSDITSKPVNIPKAYSEFIKAAKECHKAGKKLIFIGNGGSAAIASHMAIDYTKNGGIRAIAFNDASLLTCLSNDFNYAKIFDAALDVYADKGDILIAISSSGNSENIINAVNKAKGIGVLVYTLSGFAENNSLRKIGDINFYVLTKKGDYGITEITHLAILHTILDMICEGA